MSAMDGWDLFSIGAIQMLCNPGGGGVSFPKKSDMETCVPNVTNVTRV